MKKCLMKIMLMFSYLVLCTCQENYNYGGDSSISPMEENEKEALYSTIQGFVGESWNGSNLYPDPCGWTPIQGVSCDLYNGLWYVTSIKIGSVSDNSLHCSVDATFTHHLFELHHLNSLSFYNCFTFPNKNPITMPKSDKWDKLANNLATLEFRSNPGIIGEITDLSCLRNLLSLVVVENGLTGKLSPTMSDMISLQKLVLAGNSFEGQIPMSWGMLTDLVIVDLSRNLLSGQLPLTFGSLTSLLKLDLSYNFLEGNIPKELGNLKKLTILDLSNNDFSGGLVRSFNEMVALEEMVLSNNPIGGELNDIKWENLQGLKYLDLSNLGLIGNVPESLAKVEGLRFIGLKSNNLSGDLSPVFEAMPCLSAFYLQGNSFTGKLKFSKSFYQKMGSRFRASENANLCYLYDLMKSGYVPFGVKPCQEDSDGVGRNTMKKMTSDGDKLHENTLLVVSLGFSENDGSFLAIRVVVFVVCLMIF